MTWKDVFIQFLIAFLRFAGIALAIGLAITAALFVGLHFGGEKGAAVALCILGAAGGGILIYRIISAARLSAKGVEAEAVFYAKRRSERLYEYLDKDGNKYLFSRLDPRIFLMPFVKPKTPERIKIRYKPDKPSCAADGSTVALRIVELILYPVLLMIIYF